MAAALTAESTSLLNTLLTQLSERLIADREAVDARFQIVHEDARRDRREIKAEIVAIRDELREAMADGFEALQTKVCEICDRGGLEHDAMRRDIDSLMTWRTERRGHEAGAQQVVQRQRSLWDHWGQNLVPIACLIITLWTVFKDELPRVQLVPNASAQTALTAR